MDVEGDDDPSDLVVRTAKMIVEAEWFLVTVMAARPNGWRVPDA